MAVLYNCLDEIIYHFCKNKVIKTIRKMGFFFNEKTYSKFIFDYLSTLRVSFVST